MLFNALQVVIVITPTTIIEILHLLTTHQTLVRRGTYYQNQDKVVIKTSQDQEDNHLLQLVSES